MHQRSVSLSRHPHGRTRPATRSGVGDHARVCEGTAGKKKGRSSVRRTQESNRTAPLALTAHQVRAGAVLPGSGGAEHQTTGAVPQPADNPSCGSRFLAEARRKNLAPPSRLPKKYFDHRLFQHPRAITLIDLPSTEVPLCKLRVG